MYVVLGINQYDNTDILGIFDEKILAETFLKKAENKFTYDKQSIPLFY